MVGVLRRHRLSYEQAVYVSRLARQRLKLERKPSAPRLPRLLTAGQMQEFFLAVERGGDVGHELLFKLLYTTGMRVSEVTRVKRSEVDVEHCAIRVTLGKGGKDRQVLFHESLQLALRLYLASTPEQVYLFETRLKQPYTPRWVQRLCRKYGEAAGIEGLHPHELRHQVLTDLTRAGLTDAQLQVLSGHSSKQALEVYQHLSLRDVEPAYHEALQSKMIRKR
jgi:integrase/recombinase XerD